MQSRRPSRQSKCQAYRNSSHEIKNTYKLSQTNHKTNKNRQQNKNRSRVKSLTQSKYNSRKSSVSKNPKSTNKKRENKQKIIGYLLETYKQLKSKQAKKQSFNQKQTNIQGNGRMKDKFHTKVQRSRNKHAMRFQNKQNQSEYINNQFNGLLTNKQLLKASLKPNKVNYMNRVSNIYDLVLSKVMLPQFVQYFLGEALYMIKKPIHVSSCLQYQLAYDWKLDEFKKVCQKIYDHSSQQDLKLFMSLSLPDISRWNSRMLSTKNTFSFSSNTTGKSNYNDSRITSCTSGQNQNRISFFNSLNKRDKILVGEEKESMDTLEKLNKKLDQYLNNYRDRNKQNQIQNQNDLPLQQKIEHFRNYKKGRASWLLFGKQN